MFAKPLLELWSDMGPNMGKSWVQTLMFTLKGRRRFPMKQEACRGKKKKSSL